MLCWSKLYLNIYHTFQAMVETVTYTPFAMTAFYFGMSILENKTIDEATNEVKTKFWPTYQVKIHRYQFHYNTI